MGQARVRELQRQDMITLTADLPLDEAAATAFGKDLVREGERLLHTIHAKTGRDAQLIEPHKYGSPQATVDGLTIRETKDSLGLVVICPVCDNDLAYPFHDLQELGRRLYNASHDRRCGSCINAEHKAKRCDEYGIEYANADD